MYRGKRIAVVVPAHNENRRVAGVVATVPEFVDRVIVVDDGSTDGTAARVGETGAGRAEVLTHRRNGGVGAAIVTGYRRALETGADVVAVMAGDGQMDPVDLPSLLDPLVEGRADYAKGDRLSHPDVLRVMPPVRLVGNVVLTRATRLATGLPIADSQCGYTAATRAALLRLDIGGLYPRYGFPNDLLIKAAARGLRVVDVRVRPIYHDGPDASGLAIPRVIPPLGGMLAAAIARRLFRRGEWRRGNRRAAGGAAPSPRPPAPGREAGGARPRLLVLTSSYPRDEEDHAGHFVRALARRWADRYRVAVLAPWDGRAPRRERDPIASIAVTRFRYAPLARWHRVAYGDGIEENLSSWAARFWLAPFLVVFALRAAWAARRADVVLSNWLLPGGAAGALARALTGRPHLALAHGGGFAALRRLERFDRGVRILRAILRRTDRLVCVSAALRDEILTAAASTGLRLSSQSVPVIPMGVEPERFARPAPAPDRARNVLFLGRLVPVKGVEVLIDAMARVPDATLHVAGAGPLEASLKLRARLLGGRVVFHGLLRGDAKREALGRAGVLVVPSRILPTGYGGRTEGLPVAVLEGMAAGCLVIASDVGGIGEVLRDGWNGLLVKQDDAEALAGRIRWALDHPELSAGMARRGRESVPAHEAGAVAARYAREIDRVLSRRPR